MKTLSNIPFNAYIHQCTLSDSTFLGDILLFYIMVNILHAFFYRLSGEMPIYSL